VIRSYWIQEIHLGATTPLPICYEGYMTRKNGTMVPDLLADPFGEQSPPILRKHFQMLGARFRFESNSSHLLRLVDSAYAGLPSHRLPAQAGPLTVRLALGSARPLRSRGRTEPPPLDMFSASGMLGCAANTSSFAVISPQARSALVVVSPQTLRFPYHTRYELIEFAAFTLAARTLGLASLHGACIGRAGRGILLMGPSGSGKSTVSLQCLLQGLDFLSEDSVFVAPDTLLATGVANFLHVRSDSLRWLERPRDAAAIRKSPVIRRRSGVTKFEVDLRRGGFRLAPSPLKIAAVVFLSAQRAGGRPLLQSLPRSRALAMLTDSQAYAANQPGWSQFSRSVAKLGAYEVSRGRHPLETVEVLLELLARG
jgi:hypothetical protein